MQMSKLLTLLFLLSAPAVYCPASEASEYLLGSQDKLRVKVYDWRSGAGDAHEWPALVGEFTVNPAGAVAFPIVGEIAADRLTTKGLAVELGERLRERVGLAQAPVASVEVLQYRPFYIVGDVDKPGEYAFRPALTVLQALGIAGGMRHARDEDLQNMSREALTSRGDVTAIQAERIRLKIHLARLYAEVDNSGDLGFHQNSDVANDPKLTSYVAVEQAALATFQRQKRSQESALKQSREFLESEITTLEAKAASIGKQMQASRSELATVDGLVARGLAVSSRQSTLQEGIAQLESSRLDTDLALLHARQEIAHAERDLADFGDRTKSQALTEASEVEAKIANLNERFQTAQAVNYRAEANVASALQSTAESQPQFFILRSDRRGKMLTSHVEEGDLVQPGDTLRILRSPGDARRLTERTVDDGERMSGVE